MMPEIFIENNIFYMKKIIFFLLTVLLWPIIGNAATGDGKTVKILAVGNSFSQDAIEQNLYELAAADGIDLVIGDAYIGGCSIERHLDNSRTGKDAYAYRKIVDGKRTEYKNRSLESILKDEAWDYVSFQQVSSLAGKYVTYEVDLPALVAYVRGIVPVKAKFLLHQTWAYAYDSDHSGFANYGRDQMTMYRAICDAVQKASSLVKIKTVIPSGTAIQNARTSFLGDRLCRDGYHLDLLYGRYTAACTWYEKLFGHVLGNSYYPEGMTPDVVRVAQLSAKEAVAHPYQVTEIDVQELPVVYKDASASVDARVEDLLSRMTLREKIYQLNQYVLGRNDNINNLGEVVKNVPAEIGSLIYYSDDAKLRNGMQRFAMEKSRLGIPILFGFDVIHGFRTIYPIPLAQAASFNTALSEAGSALAAFEAYYTGVDWTFSPMVDVARDPRWGRVAEGYGEDPYVNSVFSAAAVRGYQGDDLSAKGTIAACLKHYVGYGASEAGRDYVPTEISRQTLWDTYLPSFEAGVKAGAATLMSSFNIISGTPASANHYTLTEVLKEKWGHDGFVVSDWDAVKQLINQGMAADGKEAAMLAFNAGVEMDMKDDLYRKYLPELIAEGKVSHELVDESVRRILRVKFRLGLFDNPYTEELPDEQRYLLPKSLSLVESMAQESMVLLKNNGNCLPLKNFSGRLAIIGPVAADGEPLLGSWSGRGKPSEVVSIMTGIKAEFGCDVVYAKGCDFEGDDESGFAEAVSAASSSDVVVLCLGEKRKWSGENASRSTIALPAVQQHLLEAVAATGKPVVLVLTSGRPLDLTAMESHATSILEIWQPGTMGGKAVAGILSGRYNPSGKLAMTFPYTTGQIPIYYNHRNSGRRGTQGLYQDIPSTPLYPFGYGLSYSTFEYSPISLSATKVKRDGSIKASVTVTNTSSVDGKEAVLWFVCDPYSHITRPVSELKHFEKLMIPAGESRTFEFEIEPLRDLGFVNETGEKYVDAGEYRITVGGQNVSIEVID